MTNGSRAESTNCTRAAEDAFAATRRRDFHGLGAAAAFCSWEIPSEKPLLSLRPSPHLHFARDDASVQAAGPYVSGS